MQNQQTPPRNTTTTQDDAMRGCVIVTGILNHHPDDYHPLEILSNLYQNIVKLNNFDIFFYLDYDDQVLRPDTDTMTSIYDIFGKHLKGFTIQSTRTEDLQEEQQHIEHYKRRCDSSYHLVYEELGHRDYILHGFLTYTTNGSIRQWYKFFKGLQMKQAYEKQHDFRYDLVMRYRPDNISPPQHFPVSRYLDPNTIYGGNDIYMYGQSELMDKLGEGLFYYGALIDKEMYSSTDIVAWGIQWCSECQVHQYLKQILKGTYILEKHDITFCNHRLAHPELKADTDKLIIK